MSTLSPSLTVGAFILLGVWLQRPGLDSAGEFQTLMSVLLLFLAAGALLATPLLLFMADKSLWKNTALLAVFLVTGAVESSWLAERHRTAQLDRAGALIRLIDAHVAHHKTFPKSLADIGPEATAIGSTAEEQPEKAFIYTIARDGTHWSLYYGRPSFSATVYRSNDRRWQVVDLH